MAGSQNKVLDKNKDSTVYIDLQSAHNIVYLRYQNITCAGLDGVRVSEHYIY